MVRTDVAVGTARLACMFSARRFAGPTRRTAEGAGLEGSCAGAVGATVTTTCGAEGGAAGLVSGIGGATRPAAGR